MMQDAITPNPPVTVAALCATARWLSAMASQAQMSGQRALAERLTEQTFAAWDAVQLAGTSV